MAIVFGSDGRTRRRAVPGAAAGIALLLAAWATPAHAVTAVATAGKACTRAGIVGRARTGATLVCGRDAKRRLVWQVPALGSLLRPVPLGQSLEAGPSTQRFRVRVANVRRDVPPGELSEFADPPAPGSTFVVVGIEAVYAGPAASGSTGHVWDAIDSAGRMYPATAGCGGGYGTTFDVTAVAARGAAVTGDHCFEVPSSSVATLRLVVEGWGGANTYFALK